MTERVALLDTVNPAAHEVFAESGLEIVEFDKSVTPEQLAEIASNTRLVGVRSGPKIPGSVMEASPNLEAIGCFCVGTNHVDRQTADELGIAIFNSVHENTRSVAEYVIGSVYGLMRRIPEHSRSMHDGVWTKTDARSNELRGKKMGIIGYGVIGSQVSVLAEANGMDVVYFDPAPPSAGYGNAKRVDTMEEVLEQADVVTLHVPGGERTKGMINAEKIALMKPGSYLINASRGEIVDYDAVAEAIADGRLGGVAADVFVDEPSKKGDKFENVLRGIPAAVLTPHIAGSTKEAQSDIGARIAAKLAGYLATGNSAGAVNLPELPLNGRQAGTSRLLHIHDNVAGVFAGLSGIVASRGLNLVGSAQKARGEIGYASLDIEGEVTEDMITEIQALNHTRRVRIIS